MLSRYVHWLATKGRVVQNMATPEIADKMPQYQNSPRINDYCLKDESLE
jgi:hypothetical protein